MNQKRYFEEQSFQKKVFW